MRKKCFGMVWGTWEQGRGQGGRITGPSPSVGNDDHREGVLESATE